MNGNKNKKNNQRYILTRETVGMTILLFCIIILVMLFTRNLVFSSIGTAVCTFMYGTFGYGSYLVIAMLSYLGVWLVWEKSIKISAKCSLVVAFSVFLCFLLFHSVTARDLPVDNFGTFLSSCYNSAAEGFSGYTFGGVISAVFVYPIAKLTTFVGAYIIFGVLFAGSLYLSAVFIRDEIVGKRAEKKAKVKAVKAPARVQTEPATNNAVNNDAKKMSVTYADSYGATENYQIVDNVPRPVYNNPNQQAYNTPNQPVYNAQSQPVYNAPSQPMYQPEVYQEQEPQSDADKFSPEKLGRKILFEKGEFAAESYRRNMIFDESSYFNKPVQGEKDYMSNFGVQSSISSQSSQSSYGESYRQSVESGSGYTPSSYVYGDKPVEKLDDSSLTEGIYKEETPVKPEPEKFEPQSNYNYNEVADYNEHIEPSRGFGRNYGDSEQSSYVNRDDNRYSQDSGRSDSHLSDRLNYDTNRSFDVDRNIGRETDRNVSRDIDRVNLDSDRNIGRETDRNVGRDIDRVNLDSDRNIGRETDRNVGRDIDRVNLDSDRSIGRDADRVVDRSVNREVENNNILGRDESNSFTEQRPEEKPTTRDERGTLGEDGGRSSNGLFNLFSSTNPNLENSSIEPDVSRMDCSRQERSKANLFDEEEEEGEDVFGSSLNDRVSDSPDISRESEQINVVPERKREMVHITPPTQEKVEAVAETPKPKHVWKKYVAPSLDLLQNYSESGSTNASEIEQNKLAIIETLANVRIESEIINVIVGSKFTRYDVRIKDNTAIKLALKHKDEIQIALRKDTINAYINFKLAALSIEVPNRESGTVGLKSILSSSQFLNSKPSSLTFALGKNIEGDCICPDITKMPHLLVAGTTGSGKSICLSSLIVSLLYRYGPSELRFILVDPKQVEFIPYENLPHLMINEIIFDVDKAIKALNWAIKEMERRYQLFKEMTANGVATKDLNEYNSHLPEGEEKLPKIVIILDEFGDLMLQAKKEIETRIVRLVQKARACGIHLILATQRPSVDCITGLIKSNLPTRIGFKVNSFDDSRTIFDIGGAEKLLGAGDMYYRRSDRPELQRVQGCFISSSEVQRVTDFVKQHNETYFDDSVSEFINTVEESEDNSSSMSEDGASEMDTKIDDTFIKALKFCVTNNQASVSMIQRRFPVGYIKACKIIDWMENMNYITQSEGSKPRKVLLSREEFINTYGDIDD